MIPITRKRQVDDVSSPDDTSLAKRLKENEWARKDDARIQEEIAIAWASEANRAGADLSPERESSAQPARSPRDPGGELRYGLYEGDARPITVDDNGQPVLALLLSQDLVQGIRDLLAGEDEVIAAIRTIEKSQEQVGMKLTEVHGRLRRRERRVMILKGELDQAKAGAVRRKIQETIEGVESEIKDLQITKRKLEYREEHLGLAVHGEHRRQRELQQPTNDTLRQVLLDCNLYPEENPYNNCDFERGRLVESEYIPVPRSPALSYHRIASMMQPGFKRRDRNEPRQPPRRANTSQQSLYDKLKHWQEAKNDFDHMADANTKERQRYLELQEKHGDKLSLTQTDFDLDLYKHNQQLTRRLIDAENALREGKQKNYEARMEAEDNNRALVIESETPAPQDPQQQDPGPETPGPENYWRKVEGTMPNIISWLSAIPSTAYSAFSTSPPASLAPDSPTWDAAPVEFGEGMSVHEDDDYYRKIIDEWDALAAGRVERRSGGSDNMPYLPTLAALKMDVEMGYIQ